MPLGIRSASTSSISNKATNGQSEAYGYDICKSTMLGMGGVGC